MKAANATIGASRHASRSGSGLSAVSAQEMQSPSVLKVVYRVGPQEAEAFDNALSGLLKAAEKTPGWLGADVIKPPADIGAPVLAEWQIVLRLQTDDDLRTWRESRTANIWRARLNALTIGAPRVERIHGLEAWFSLPERRHVTPAPKWKMAIISSLAIYPLILLLPEVLSPKIQDAPQWLASLVSVAIAIPLMTWVVMPTMTRLFRNWLYKRSFQQN